MEKLNELIVNPEITVVEAMAVIDKGGVGTAFVCEGELLVAIVTDGDIRRHILKGKSLESPVSAAANYDFVYITSAETRKEALDIMKKNVIMLLPVLDENKKLADIELYSEPKPKEKPSLQTPVVIMAGGKGTRLYPYTKVLPKPLIPIGDKTITELIMDQFLPYDSNDFTMIVNHKKNMIKAFFADEELGYYVDFVDEDIPMGTGGGLALLKGKMASTFFLTNCDILIFEDYSKIMDYHQSNNNLITMVCASETVTIPYGTVEVNECGQIVKMQEKPSFSFLTNTGFYILEPEILNYVPENQFIHITDIIQHCIDADENVGMYPISENQWSDMGQMEEMDKMREKLTRL